jgi:hypothetical protein
MKQGEIKKKTTNPWVIPTSFGGYLPDIAKYMRRFQKNFGAPYARDLLGRYQGEFRRSAVRSALKPVFVRWIADPRGRPAPEMDTCGTTGTGWSGEATMHFYQATDAPATPDVLVMTEIGAQMAPPVARWPSGAQELLLIQQSQCQISHSAHQETAPVRFAEVPVVVGAMKKSA